VSDSGTGEPLVSDQIDITNRQGQKTNNIYIHATNIFQQLLT